MADRDDLEASRVFGYSSLFFTGVPAAPVECRQLPCLDRSNPIKYIIAFKMAGEGNCRLSG